MEIPKTNRWLPPNDDRVTMLVHDEARRALHHLLMSDYRFKGVGYSEFIMHAVNSVENRDDFSGSKMELDSVE